TTRIGKGTKIDNLVQIGHNVRVGKNSIICGQVGVSGSCDIGAGVIMGGQVGLSDHMKIGDGAILGGRSGVITDVPAGAFYSGFPAAPHRTVMKMHSAMKRLPELIEKMEKSTGAKGTVEEEK
ncbi:MAG TPA: UDP-3-O-(3-hydroxymyristoyl)glucosamine N-acyltransferase, partial [bacterium]|nr:UDP-3-O-(3-hydroxymyristoyl)glucosamine N-acyltransferase [bacterium]